MRKIHITDVSEQLTVYWNLKMRCGQVLTNAQVMFEAAHEVAYGMSLPMSTCWDCQQATPEYMPGVKYYVYGLVEKADEPD